MKKKNPFQIYFSRNFEDQDLSIDPNLNIELKLNPLPKLYMYPVSRNKMERSGHFEASVGGEV